MSSSVVKLVAVVLIASAVTADEEYTAALHHEGGGRVSRVRRQSAFPASKFGSGGTFVNKTLRIATIDLEPYCKVEKAEGTANGFKYTGFIPDLIEALSRRLYFNYEFYNVSSFGRWDPETRQWTGLIGEVIKRDNTEGRQGADIAAASITITAARERVVDFLKPFQHTGITAIVRRPVTTFDTYTFSIFQPLQPTVWGLILLSSAVVGLFLWVMNMYNPYEWGCRQSLGLAEQRDADLFGISGSIWFVLTSLNWQGFERAPRSISSKFLTCVWFTFVTIVMVTYTAGIVNNLYWATMVHRPPSSPTRPRYIDLAHLVSSNDFKYGTLNNSQTYRYIMQVANGEEFDVMRRYWQSPEGQAQLVSSMDEGLRRARDSNYVFLMESLFAKYHANKRPCDLVTVGEPFGVRGYGFALPTSLPFEWSNELHAAVLELTEEGDIADMERRWFVDVSECWNVTQIERLVSDVTVTMNVDKPRSVDVATFTGPLVLIVVGLLISVGIAVAEVLYYQKHGRYQSGNRPQGQQLGMEPDEGNM